MSNNKINLNNLQENYDRNWLTVEEKEDGLTVEIKNIQPHEYLVRFSNETTSLNKYIKIKILERDKPHHDEIDEVAKVATAVNDYFQFSLKGDKTEKYSQLQNPKDEAIEIIQTLAHEFLVKVKNPQKNSLQNEIIARFPDSTQGLFEEINKVASLAISIEKHVSDNQYETVVGTKNYEEFISTIGEDLNCELIDRDMYIEAEVEKYVALLKIVPNRNNNTKILKLFLEPKNVDIYYRLQQKIAALVPIELDRPIIELELKGTNANLTPIGILGGVGPLSDAEVIREVIHTLEHRQVPLDRIHVQLLSAPPPRSIQQPQRGYRYINKLREFTKVPKNGLYITSNTAHINLPALQKLKSQNTPLVDMVSLITQDIAQMTKTNSQVLVLGTTSAWENKLYPTKLKTYSIKSIELDAKDQNLIQQLIEQTKQGKTNIAEAGIDIINKYIENKGATHVILACTELPLLFKSSNIDLQVEFPNLQIIDTEQKFVEYIAKAIEKQVNAPSN
ncbi:MAG: putative aspartate racemase [Chlamydiales bacterium]|jgi:aspartate/glutamate racemase|nr:putative aspartate racemase [Chlamydiales bacterium]